MEGGDFRMSTVDERVVQMQFQNAAFERGVQQTLASLERLQRGLQLKDASKGITDAATRIAASSQQFDKNVLQNRDSMGRFTKAVTDNTTAATGSLSRITNGVTQVASSVESGFNRTKNAVTGFTQSVGGFGDRIVSSLNGINKNADQQTGSLKNLEGGVNSLASRFSNLGSIATGALMNIGARAQEAGTRFLSSFTFSPILDGFREYETNMNSIQTILANTQSAGTNLKDVTRALDELNHYSDQTIYNFSEMAKNIGTFTAAGVALEPATAAIKGIANLAALSGSNSEQASGAMYQLSQAISAGRVTLEDWNSVVNAGMGGTVFQRALALNAEKMGTLKDGAVKLTGEMKNVTIGGKSFRESITAKPGQESWLTSKVLTQTLAQFTGDLKDSELAAQGFSKAQIKAIQDQAKMAKSAATEVKTLTQLFGTFKEQMGSGWAQTWQIIFGDFAEAKGLFTGISDSVGKMLQNSSEARNKMLKDWDSLGGRTALIEGITNVFKALGSVLSPIKDAFRDIFPATTGKQLADMTKNFRDFTEKLKVGSETGDKIKRTFTGVFAVFGIAVDIVKGFVGVIADLFGVATQGSGGFLNFTANVGDFLVAVRNGIREGEGLTHFFKGLGAVLAVPIKLVQELAGWLGRMFKDTDSSAVEKSVEGVSSKLEPLGRLGDVASAAWEKTLTVMKNVGDFFSDLGGRVSEVFSAIGIDAAKLFEGFDFEKLLAGINTGALAGLFLIIKNFLADGPAGIFEGIGDAIEGFTGTLKGMQNALNAAVLLQIALAVGILALSMNTLAKIDAAGLARASAGIATMFGQLVGTMVLFNKFVGVAGFAKLPFVMGSLILLAGAVLILSQALKQMAGLDWNELSKGLTGLAVTLGLLVASLKFMPMPAGLISTGLGLIVLGAAIKILASAVEDLSSLGWNELSKGLVGVGVLLGALTLFTMFSKVNAGAVAQGAGLVLLAAGIKILASAVKDLSKLSWGNIASGLVALAGSLGIITAALMFIPPTAPSAALGVLGVAVSLKLIANALGQLAKMSWANIASSLTVMLGALTIISAALWIIPPTAPLAAAGILITAFALKQIGEVLSGFAEYSWGEIGKAMTMLAGTMVIIAGALLFMTTALPGAAATLIVAAALAVLAPVLMQFSQMSLSEIGLALLMLAGVFVVFGAAAILLAPVVPVMIGLGLAVTLLGVGMMAAGAGVFLFATGLTALAAAGSAAAAAIVGIVAGLIGLIPEVMNQIGLGLIAFAKVIATAGPAISKAIETVLNAIIDAIVRLVPKITNALFNMLTKMMNTMLKYVPTLVQTGMKLVTAIFNGVAKNLPQMVDAATRVVVKFIEGVSRNLSKIIDSGVKLIISFINGVTKAIDSNSQQLGAAGGRLGIAIIKGMAKGVMGGIGEITNAAKSVASSALNAAKSALGINSPSKEFEKIGKFVNDGFRKGLDGNKEQVYSAFNDLKKMLLDLSKNAKASTSERRKAAAAYSELTKKLNDEKTAIGRLSEKYDGLTEKIKKANETYQAAIKTRDDYRKSISDQYSDMATPADDISVADYITNLEKQVEDTKVFSNQLQKLRAFGLNDEMYQDLLGKGTAALPFINELLNGGKTEIDKINSLGKELDKAGEHLGKTASTSLYQAAVDSAKGLVEGLKKEQANIEKQMDRIAEKMVKAIKKKLGIKSPSRVFMEVGAFSAEGLAKGLDEMSGIVERSAERTGTAAVESLRKSISGFSDLITQDVVTQPVITPVLDLSSVRKDAGALGGIFGGRPLAVDSAYAKAKYVAAGYARNQAAYDQTVGETSPAPVSFVQNNYSPKALSPAEIYRQTNNQLSKAKGALTTNANSG
jgi:tape measure domain-containing protein